MMMMSPGAKSPRIKDPGFLLFGSISSSPATTPAAAAEERLCRVPQPSAACRDTQSGVDPPPDNISLLHILAQYLFCLPHSPSRSPVTTMSLPLVTLCLVLSAAQCRAQAADTSAIDFSAAGGAVVDPDTGAVCVEREEEVEKVEQLSEQQCTQQTVSQVRTRGGEETESTNKTSNTPVMCVSVLQQLQHPVPGRGAGGVPRGVYQQ